MHTRETSSQESCTDELLHTQSPSELSDRDYTVQQLGNKPHRDLIVDAMDDYGHECMYVYVHVCMYVEH